METKIKLLPKIRMQFTYNGVNAVIVECDYWFCVYAECPEYKDSEKLHATLATVYGGITYVGSLYEYGIPGTFVGVDTLRTGGVDFEKHVNLLSLNDALHIAFRMCNFIAENRRTEQLRAELYRDLNISKEQL